MSAVSECHRDTGLPLTALWQTLKSSIATPPVFLLLLKSYFGSLGFLCLQVNFTFVFLVLQIIGILMGDFIKSAKATFSNVAIFPILILMMHVSQLWLF